MSGGKALLGSEEVALAGQQIQIGRETTVVAGTGVFHGLGQIFHLAGEGLYGVGILLLLHKGVTDIFKRIEHGKLVGRHGGILGGLSGIHAALDGPEVQRQAEAAGKSGVCVGPSQQLIQLQAGGTEQTGKRKGGATPISKLAA